MESRKKDRLSKLPDELKLLVSESYVSNFITLPQTSKRFSLLFFEEHRLALKCLKQLLSHAALGEWDEARTIWKFFPDLLTCRGTIYHPNPANITPQMNPGRYKYVDRTAWQIAWMNEEYEIAAEMADHMDGDEMKKQFAEIFPSGELVKNNWDFEKAKILLKAVFDRVIEDQSMDEKNRDIMSESTRHALYALYAYVKPEPNHSTGLVFDARIYVEALALYDNRKASFNNWKQCSFWCIRVEEHLASLLGTDHLRRHVRGNGNNIKLNGCTVKEGKRDDSPYFAFRRPSDSIPGFHFFIAYAGLLALHLLSRNDGTSGKEFNEHIENTRVLGESLRDHIHTQSNKKTAYET